MSGHLILDTGPWVALHCRDDAHHAWGIERGVVRMVMSLADEVSYAAGHPTLIRR